VAQAILADKVSGWVALLRSTWVEYCE